MKYLLVTSSLILSSLAVSFFEIQSSQAHELNCAQSHAQLRNRAGLMVRLEAKPGKEGELEELLKKGLHAVLKETKTTTWFSYKLGPTSFGIFSTFQNDSSRQEHMNGRLAQVLMEKGSDLLASPPQLEPAQVLGAKVP